MGQFQMLSQQYWDSTGLPDRVGGSGHQSVGLALDFPECRNHKESGRSKHSPRYVKFLTSCRFVTP